MSNPTVAMMEESHVTVFPRSRGSKWRQPGKLKGKENKGFVRVTCPWLAAMPMRECPFKNPGVGQALHIVSVLAAASSVLLAVSRKAGVWSGQQAIPPKLSRRERRKWLKVSVAALGSPNGMPSGKGLGWWLRQSPAFHNCQPPRVG